MKKILITGTSGFIGRHMKEKLEMQYEVLAPPRAELDLLDSRAVEEYLDKKKVNIVIHSAVQRTLGLSQEYERQVLSNNLRMFCNFERCGQYYDKMIFLGSGAEFGRESYKPFMQEEYFGNTVPNDDYGLSKYIMTKMAEASGNIYNLRLFGIFGPYENYNYRFISNAICKTLQGMDIVIHRNVLFDYLYVDDFCNILERFLDIEPQYTTYNVCTGLPVEILAIAKLIRKLSGASNNIIVEQQGLGQEYSGDNSRILKEIGNYKFMDMEESISRLLSFYKENNFELRGDY